MTDEQTPYPPAALIAELYRRAKTRTGVADRWVYTSAADALVQEKARADIAEKEAQLARENYSKEAQQQKARANRLAAIVREARELLPLFDVLAQAEAEGLLR